MNPYVVTWVVTAGAGALLSIFLLFETWLDYRALNGAKNGRRVRIFGRAAQECVRLSVHVPFLVIGIAALDVPVRPESTVNILILLYGNVAMIINSVITFYVRRKADASLLVSAEEAARTVLSLAAAERAVAATDAKELISKAAEVAATLRNDETSRVADAAERTASNTDKIARNTSRISSDEDSAALDESVSNLAEATERTAENTARIAENTSPKD